MINIVPLSKENLEAVCEIEKESLSTAWGKKELEKELENKNAVYFCAQKDGETVGFIGMWNIAGEGNITNVAVHPDFRKKGIGSLLVNKMICYSKNNNIAFLTLEVNENNKNAYSLYKKCGFYEIGRRKKYYSNKFDAILMQYDIEN